MRRQASTAFAFAVALALLAPGLDGVARAFDGYTLGLTPFADPWRWPDPGEEPESGSALPGLAIGPTIVRLPTVFPLPPVLLLPIPRGTSTGGCFPYPLPTKTEVTDYPSRANKNGSVTFGGYVTDEKGTPLGGVPVELFVNETKELPGAFVGSTVTSANGRWSLTTRIPPELEAQRYHVVNHAGEARVGCQGYAGSWSDPEMDLHANTRIALGCPERVLAGRDEACDARLVDDVRTGVGGRPVVRRIDGSAISSATTGSDGAFAIPFRFNEPGTHVVSARYAGEKYYNASFAQTTIEVVAALLVVDTLTLEADVGGGEILRGRIVSFIPIPEGDVAAASDALDVPAATPIGADGRFEIPFEVPRGTPPGEHVLLVSVPWLGQSVPVTVQVYLGTRLELTAPDRVFAWGSADAEARLTTTAGDPLPGRRILLAVHEDRRLLSDAGRALEAVTDENGVARFAVGDLRWGAVELAASYRGGDHERGAESERVALDVALPWWLLALVALAVVALALGVWKLATRSRPQPPPPLHVVAVPGAPPLALSIVTPADSAPTILGVGDSATIAVPRVSGAARVRVHAPAHLASPGPIESHDGEMIVEILAVGKGDAPTRIVAEDANGVPLAASEILLRGVVYAEEIERGYGALVRSSDASPRRVTPREFEAIFARRPGVARKALGEAVTLFEIADYSARLVGREAFLAFHSAERLLAPRREDRDAA